MLTNLFAPPAALKLAENDFQAVYPDIVDILKIGTFYLADGTKVNVTGDMLDSMVKNFIEKVRKIDLAIDYKHEADDKAAGWFSEVFRGGDDNDTLQARVKWTPEGKKVLGDKEFRYLSAEFHLDYQDNESLKRFGPTLLGAGLTNRPVIKGMNPAVQLSERAYQSMDELMSKYAEMVQKCTELDGEVKNLKDLLAKQGKTPEDKNMDKVQELEMKLSEAVKSLDAATKQIADLNVENKAFKDEKAKLAGEQKLAEKKSKFDKMLTENKAVEAQREAFMSDDLAKFAELAQDAKTVRLSESVKTEEKVEDGEKSVTQKIHTLAEKLISDKKATGIGEAYSMVLRDPNHKALSEEYNKSQQV